MNHFLALIVRCKNEPYVKEFTDYYLGQGVDKIFIFDDNSSKETYKDVIENEKVEIIARENKNKHVNDDFQDFYKKIKNKYTWMILVDMDEYITTKKNSSNTIKKELETTFKDATCIKIPWVMMSCNSIEKNPESLLQTNIYRWNHDKRHSNNRVSKFRCRYDKIEIKCIFKSAFFENINDHHPLIPLTNVVTVESINNTNQPLDPFYHNLREKDIKEGYLLCYHYRIVSVENCLNKIKYNCFYKNFTLEDLMSNDYPEVIDETLKVKTTI
jgi:hypothetical protein